MIHLTKTPAPPVLINNAAKWTQELLKKIAENKKPTDYLLSRYRDPDIKSALLKETNEKCAYCESPLRHISYGDIEHITPKSSSPEKRFEWENLTLACDICNTNKSDKNGIIDPYLHDPSALFDFHGPLVWGIPTSEEAVYTEAQLNLNRNGLVERRRERIEYLRYLIDSASSKNPDIREAMMRAAKIEIGKDKPFSACTSAIFEKIVMRYRN